MIIDSERGHLPFPSGNENETLRYLIEFLKQTRLAQQNRNGSNPLNGVAGESPSTSHGEDNALASDETSASHDQHGGK